MIMPGTAAPRGVCWWRLAGAREDYTWIVVRLPLRPGNPDRICWGCDKFCPADDMRCGNGTIRCPHPIEIFGDDWVTEVPEAVPPAAISRSVP